MLKQSPLNIEFPACSQNKLGRVFLLTHFTMGLLQTQVSSNGMRSSGRLIHIMDGFVNNSLSGLRDSQLSLHVVMALASERQECAIAKNNSVERALCRERVRAYFPGSCHVVREHKLSGQKNPLRELLKHNMRIRRHSCGLLGARVAEPIALFSPRCQVDSEQKQQGDRLPFQLQQKATYH